MTSHTMTRDSSEVAPNGATSEEVRADELLRDYDTSSRYRTELGFWNWVIGAVAVAYTAYHLWYALERPVNGWIHAALHLAGATSLIFLLYPVSRRLLRFGPTTPSWQRWLLGKGPGVAWYDIVLAAVGLLSNMYILARYDYLTGNAVKILGYTPLDLTVAILGIVLTLEATRRCVGLPIVIIAGVAIAYALFGEYSPIFSHPGLSLETYATSMFLTTSNGVFGVPLQVSANFIFLFLLFAVLLMKTNIGQFFNDLAFRATGRFTGGPAKAAVVASGLQGMISGSSVANTVGSGSFTIPLMKKAGFKPNVAAAAEATASTGGQIMPPIMGAAAFIMAQNVPGIEYNELIVIAIIPALLYFTGVLLSIHFEAKRTGIHGTPLSQLPTIRSLLIRSDLILPLVVIVGTLMVGFTPTRAALLGIATAFVLSFFRKSTRLGLRGIIDTFVLGARTALPVIAACATAGIVAGTVTSTGLGGRLGHGLVQMAGGNFLLVLFFVMIACLILGMGLPTSANYVVTAAVAAPILYNNFDVPLIAAHMFVFFFGILADITPPVCLAVFAASGLAGSNPMKTGVTAVRLAIAAFLIPYVFVLQPALLLQGTWDELVTSLVTLLLGMVAIAAGIAGYFLIRMNAVERTLFIIGGALLAYPDFVISGVGLLVLAIGVGLHVLSRRRASRSDHTADMEVVQSQGA